ncbi:MAG TPA: histidinol-phosphatase HisJ family protein [Corynebacteriales bacterium]|nr:histidinol-phosphatase HisJ family protein [Mycobacteriales bacterium]
MLCDYHVHSDFSHDCSTSMEDVCEMAVRKGLSKICFTEHLDFDRRDEGWRYFKPEKYLSRAEKYKEAYKGELSVSAGVEVTYQSVYASEIAEFLELHKFDYVTGAVHMVNHTIVGSPGYFVGKLEDEAYGEYWSELLSMVQSGLVRTVAHMDYIKNHRPTQYGPFIQERWQDELVQILECIIEREVLLEVNTSALRRGLGAPYPSWDIIRLYRYLGGNEVILGSDAHFAEDVGAHFADVSVELSSMGLVVGAQT